MPPRRRTVSPYRRVPDWDARDAILATGRPIVRKSAARAALLTTTGGADGSATAAHGSATAQESSLERPTGRSGAATPYVGSPHDSPRAFQPFDADCDDHDRLGAPGSPPHCEADMDADTGSGGPATGSTEVDQADRARDLAEKAFEALLVDPDGLGATPLVDVCASVDEWLVLSHRVAIRLPGREWQEIVAACAMARIGQLETQPVEGGSKRHGSTVKPPRPESRGGPNSVGAQPLLHRARAERQTRREAGNAFKPQPVMTSLAQERECIEAALQCPETDFETVFNRVLADEHAFFRAAASGLRQVVEGWGPFDTSTRRKMPLCARGRLQAYLLGCNVGSPQKLRDWLAAFMLVNCQELAGFVVAAHKSPQQWPTPQGSVLLQDCCAVHKEGWVQAVGEYGARICAVGGTCWQVSNGLDNGMLHTHTSLQLGSSGKIHPSAITGVGSWPELMLLARAINEQCTCICRDQESGRVASVTFDGADMRDGRVSDAAPLRPSGHGNLILTVDQCTPGSYAAFSSVCVCPRAPAPDRTRTSREHLFGPARATTSTFTVSDEDEEPNVDAVLKRPRRGAGTSKAAHTAVFIAPVTPSGDHVPEKHWILLHPKHDVERIHTKQFLFSEGQMRLVMEGVRYMLNNKPSVRGTLAILPVDLLQSWEASLSADPLEIWWLRNRQHFGENRRTGCPDSVTMTSDGPVDIFRYQYLATCGCLDDEQHWCTLVVCNPSSLTVAHADQPFRIVLLDSLGLQQKTCRLAQTLGSWVCMQHNYARPDLPYMPYHGDTFARWMGSVLVTPDVCTQDAGSNNCGALAACMLYSLARVVESMAGSDRQWLGRARDASLKVGDRQPLPSARVPGQAGSPCTCYTSGTALRVALIRALHKGADANNNILGAIVRRREQSGA
mmetsp:Transcript_23840/g.58873  ORF Transcript_23840/g.58873 Transcript_23840/m.58873 type:complete len:901 (+) Transcript_23840:190-2892(+)